MKEMGLPLGFFNVSYEIDANNGLVELPVRAGRGERGGSRRRVIEEDMRDEFFRELWPQHGEPE